MVRNWIYYGLVLLLSLLFVYFYGDKIAYVTLYVIVMLPPVSGVIAFISKFYIKVSQSINSEFVLKGDDIVYTVTFHNKSFFSLSHIKVVFFDDPKSKDRIYSDITTKMFQVAAKQKKNVKFNIKCLYRGLFEVGADYIEFMDMLGLFRFKFIIKNKVQVLVYPRIIELKNFQAPLIRMSKALSNLEMSEEDYTTVTDIRKYQDSDSYKKIHWKLSAKKKELLVKNFQNSIVNSAALFVDLRQIPLNIEDKLVESVISITDYCLKKRIPVELHYFDKKHEVFTESSASGFFNIYSICATVVFSGQGNFSSMLYEYTSGQTDQTNIVLFTSRLDIDLANNIIEISNFGHNVVLIYISDEHDKSLLNELKNSGILCFEGPPQDFIA